MYVYKVRYTFHVLSSTARKQTTLDKRELFRSGGHVRDLHKIFHDKHFVRCGFFPPSKRLNNIYMHRSVPEQKEFVFETQTQRTR